MSQYDNLKATIASNVYENHNNQVTANMVKAAMNAMVDSLGAGYQYLGVATPATAPGTPDQKVFYIAPPGEYPNFGTGITVADGEIAILKYDTAWHKEVTGAATAAQLTELGQKVEDLESATLSKLYIERGGLSTSNGSEDNSTNAKNRRARNKGFIYAPFVFEINTGSRIGALLKYDKSGTFVSAQTYPASAPFTTKITITDESYIYRVLCTKEDATQDYTDQEIAGLLKNYSGKVNELTAELRRKIDSDIAHCYPNFCFYEGAYFENDGLNIIVHCPLMDVSPYTNVFGVVRDVRISGTPGFIYCTLPATLPSGVVVSNGVATITLTSLQSICLDSNNQLAIATVDSSEQYRYILHNFRGAPQFGWGVDSIQSRSILKVADKMNTEIPKLNTAVAELETEVNTFSSRNCYIIKNKVISYTAGNIAIYDSGDWDIIIVNVPSNADKIKVTNYALARFYCFDSNAINDFTTEHFIGVIAYTADTFLLIPANAKMLAVVVRKSDYPNGYGGIGIYFNDKFTDDKSNPNYYTGDVIDLAKRWEINLWKILGTAKTVQSMAHYGDRLFMLGNADNLVQLYIYDLNTGVLIKEFADVDTGVLTAVHCNVSFFGKEFYTGNEKYPLLYTSQWNGTRALLAYNIIENEDRDNYTIELVQVITPDGTQLASEIGAGYMDYIYDPISDKLVSISYDVASNGYYDIVNDAHIAIFDMPLLSDGSSVELDTAIDSFRIPPIPVRQDMTIYNGKLYLFSGFGTSEWPAYLNVIDIHNEIVANKILISEAYDSIFGEPEGVDIINGYLCVTSNSQKGKLYTMNFR